MTRIDGYLSRKAQNVWPAGIVSVSPLSARGEGTGEGSPGNTKASEQFILDPHNGSQPVELGTTFNAAHTALLALMKSARIQKDKPQ